MDRLDALKVGYVVKRYPRFSETFIVSEILAHEKAGADVRIFALRPSFDTHFQNVIARVRAPVRYLTFDNLRATDYWQYVTAAAEEFPGAAQLLLPGAGETPVEICQGIALAREALAAGLHHLHAHFATSATTVTRIASRVSGIPYTFTAHAKDIFHREVDPTEFERKLRDAAACVTVSDFNCAFLQARHGPAPVLRIYNGLNLRDFPYSAPISRPPVILGVGRLVEKKGFADLIDACAELEARGERFSCRIIGTGPLEADLQRRIDALGISHCVTLVGARPQEDVIGEMLDAAALAAPCIVAEDGDRDGLPTVVLEAMALGTPCVGTPVTGLKEVIADARTGLIVPERDPAALSFALSRLLNDAALRTRLAGAARRQIEADFDIEPNTARLRHVFAESRQAQPLERT